MHKVIFVRMEKREREIVRRALDSIGVGFPGYPYEPNTHEHHLMRALTGVAKDGSQMSRDLLLTAREALERQAAQCAIEADLEHWRTNLLRPAPVGASVGGGVPLVADPQQMCEYLAETRSVQLREAYAAIAVVNEALGLIP